MSRVYYDTTAYQEAKAKLPKPDGKHCILCGKDLPKRKRKYCSQQCFDKWYKQFPILDWNEIRKRVQRRDKWTCQECGEIQRSLLQVHHIEPIISGGNEFDVDNCITLCRNCHKKAHRKLKIKKIIQGKRERMRALEHYLKGER